MKAESKMAVQGLFGLLALVGGVGGGWYAHAQTSSWWLAGFVFLIVSFVVGRGIPDVITDPDKGQRIMFFGLPPLVATAALSGAYWLWETWWLAVMIGFVAYMVGFGISTAAFPAIAADEDRDNRARMGAGSDHPGAPTRAPEMEEHETFEMLADAGIAQGKLSFADRGRFIELMEAGRIQEALELTTDTGGAPVSAGSFGKYGNRKY